MSSSPAVILSDIPIFLRSNGKATASHILGSKTGVEVGACYWKLHPTLPRFMVVFKNKFDRDNWYKTSVKLDEMKRNGVYVSVHGLVLQGHGQSDERGGGASHGRWEEIMCRRRKLYEAASRKGQKYEWWCS